MVLAQVNCLRDSCKRIRRRKKEEDVIAVIDVAKETEGALQLAQELSLKITCCRGVGARFVFPDVDLGRVLQLPSTDTANSCTLAQVPMDPRDGIIHIIALD